MAAFIGDAESIAPAALLLALALAWVEELRATEELCVVTVLLLVTVAAPTVDVCVVLLPCVLVVLGDSNVVLTVAEEPDAVPLESCASANGAASNPMKAIVLTIVDLDLSNECDKVLVVNCWEGMKIVRSIAALV